MAWRRKRQPNLVVTARSPLRESGEKCSGRDGQHGDDRESRESDGPRLAPSAFNGRGRVRVADPFQLEQQISRGLPPVVGVLGKTARDDAIAGWLVSSTAATTLAEGRCGGRPR